jgi:hypothetical protein
MKKFTLLLATALLCQYGFAQDDSSKVIVAADTTQPASKNDTIRIGNILIIKKGKKSTDDEGDNVGVTMGRHDNERKKSSKVSTNWGVLDIGFSNYDDKTDYTNTGSYLVNRPGSPALGKSDFKLRTGKSINVNIWFFMQRLSLIKNHVNLKYGLGLELNNYRYKSSLSYRETGVIPYSGGLQTNTPFIFRDSISFSKNKLAADYLTVPFMINFASNPHSSKKGISISLGASAGYLYSQRNKQKSDERGKDKNKGEYDLERFKLAYIAELGLGPVRLYGSYSPKSMYEHSLDMRPYTLGLRFSNW